MHAFLTGALALVIFGVIYILHHRKSQNATTVSIHPSFDPFNAFDVQLKNHLDLTSLVRQHGRYGATFQLTPLVAAPIIYTISPENIKEIMTNGNDFGVEPLRGESMGPFCGRGFLTSDGDAWLESRKMLKVCFGKKHIEDLTTFDAAVGRLTEKIVDAGGDTVDLQPLLIDLFIDNSLRFLLGTEGREDAGPSSSRAEFLGSFESGLLGTGLRIMLGSYRFVLPKGSYLKTCRAVHDWLDYHIDRQSTARSAEATRSTNLLRQKGSMAYNLSGQTDDTEYIRSQILQSMLASKETTAMLVSNTMFLLARNPAVWQKLREEIRHHPNRDELFTLDGMLAFAYMQNILKEAFRLHPVFPLNARVALRNTKLPTSPDPSNPQATRHQPVPVPKGTTVIMSFYAMNRSEKVFGSNIESFNPDRWTSIHPTQYEFLPFGGGQRACLGREKSLAEAGLAVGRLAERFATLQSKDAREFKSQTGISCCNGNGCKVALIISQ
ncbi:cytochrome P450 [Pleomassaria siparia CBS 279.74]|uniref:Cytochrome P450 n=1 Tax=Pleomassaria siparia CBS 279.74 TaxID=1314801 RepID=A0A6G1JRV0_9PLEO|nr:cytochrome P450 [Pleomassaria siparia CBS 279.74]